MALILIVEDEPKLVAILERYLHGAGYQTERAGDGLRALELFRATCPDLVLLDIMLPGQDGYEVLKKVRAQSEVPIIMLTARVEELDTVLSLELGADDYVTKPFRPREVVARVKAALRRTAQPEASSAPLRHGSLVLEPEKFRARVSSPTGDTKLDLTPTEFSLLLTLMRAPGRVFSRGELIGAAMPESDALERTVDAHLTRVRRKLGQHGIHGVITNVRGVGYRLEEK